MQRLRDAREPSATVADAVRLLGTMAPHQPSPTRKARIRRALDRAGRRRRGGFALRPVLVAIALLGFATVAGATIGRYWLGPRLAKPAPEKTGGSVGGVAPRKAAHRGEGLPQAAPIVAPVAGAPFVGVPVPGVPVPGVPVPGAPVAHAPIAGAHGPTAPVAGAPAARVSVARPSSDPDPTPEPVEPPGDAALLVQGFKSLRNDRDAGQAGELAELYLQRHPDGVLAEEALALAIEAAGARDDARAATLAARYLARFPAGRFTEAAHRAQQRFAP